ncbi:hypothetical protein HYW46_07125 [Candidatus Daviesbacteria bacterium]|nr:hypothetical protein [Candidatus Daviesbacteria bacterium]
MQEKPLLNPSYGLFLIRNKSAFNLETIIKLHGWASGLKAYFSLEKLFKGSQSASVIFAPLSVVDFLPELQLLQLETYLPGVENTYVWSIAPNKTPKKITVDETFLQEISLTDEQQFFWQVVCFPQKGSSFNVTVRAMVKDNEQVKRIGLAKTIDRHILDCTGLIKQRDETNTELYNAFENRSLIKKEALNFLLTAREILNIASLV